MLAADVFWLAHEQSKGKHARYEGQPCPESLEQERKKKKRSCFLPNLAAKE